MATVTSGVGRPAEEKRSLASVPSAWKWSFGARVEIIIGASVNAAGSLADRIATLSPGPVVLGAVDDEVLPSLVAAAGVFAFPSAREGFGLAAMEALAAGVPLVVSDLPVFREIFSGAARFAAGPGALTAALLDGLTRPGPAARAAGQALAARYTWRAAAAEHLRLYRSLITSR